MNNNEWALIGCYGAIFSRIIASEFSLDAMEYTVYTNSLEAIWSDLSLDKNARVLIGYYGTNK